MLDELEHAWADLDGDPDVRVIVNTGRGDAFQTGLDMVTARPGPRRPASSSPDAPSEPSCASRPGTTACRKPVIAAVNGVCAGGGLHFVADADIVIASSRAQFLDPHVSVGQVTAYEAIALARSRRWRRSCAWRSSAGTSGCRRARAYELGMISQVVDPPERLREEAQALAETIARNSPAAMAATKRALWGALESG